MKKLKVMTILGTRPDIIKLSRVMSELEKFTDHVLVHTGQNYDYELNEVFFEELGVKKPDYFLEVAKQNLAQDMGNIISRIDPVLEKEQPDAVLFYGDTNTTLAAIPVKRRRIPIFHMEAGNRCFDYRVPEEINRKIIDHLSDINMTISEHARQYLIREGIRADSIFKVGSCLKEIYSYYWDKILASSALSKLQLKPKEYFMVSLHREDNVDRADVLNSLVETLGLIADQYKKCIMVSTHPRTKKRLDDLNIILPDEVEFHKPFGFFDYIKLQLESFCVLSDSGSITEESSILNFPAVTIRRMHERPEGMDVGAIIMTGLNPDLILQSIEVVTQQYQEGNRQMSIAPDYDVDNVSKKVVRIILSYVDYVNQNVWKKY